MSLTDKEVRFAKPEAKEYTLRDERNLFLRVAPDGARYWIFRYFYAGKQRPLSLGTYPEISLQAARDAAAECRADLRAGRDPKVAREVRRAKVVESTLNTFASVGAEWFARNTLKPGEVNDKKWSPRNSIRVAGIMRLCLMPELGPLPVDEIPGQLVKRVLLDAQEQRGGPTARQAQAVCAAIFRHAVAGGLTVNNPALALKDVLDPRGNSQHHAALPFALVGPFLRELARYDCAPVMRAAIRLQMSLAMRDTSLRTLQWCDVDIASNVPHVFSPARRNKGRVARRRDYVTPLPRQAVAILRDLEPLTGESPESFVFASYSKAGHLSHGAISQAVQTIAGRLGVKATCHGFRSMLRDWAAHNGYPDSMAKTQLMQVVGDQTDQAYLRTDFFEQRQAMLQHFADAIEAAELNLEPVEKPSNVHRLRVAGHK